MPLLPKASKRTPKATLSVRLDPTLIEQLDEYCEFLGNGRQDIVQNALAYIFNEDKEFQAWAHKRKSVMSPKNQR